MYTVSDTIKEAKLLGCKSNCERKQKYREQLLYSD